MATDGKDIPPPEAEQDEASAKSGEKGTRRSTRKKVTTELGRTYTIENQNKRCNVLIKKIRRQIQVVEDLLRRDGDITK